MDNDVLNESIWWNNEISSPMPKVKFLNKLNAIWYILLGRSVIYRVMIYKGNKIVARMSKSKSLVLGCHFVSGDNIDIEDRRGTK